MNNGLEDLSQMEKLLQVVGIPRNLTYEFTQSNETLFQSNLLQCYWEIYFFLCFVFIMLLELHCDIYFLFTWVWEIFEDTSLVALFSSCQKNDIKSGKARYF